MPAQHSLIGRGNPTPAPAAAAQVREQSNRGCGRGRSGREKASGAKGPAGSASIRSRHRWYGTTSVG